MKVIMRETISNLYKYKHTNFKNVHTLAILLLVFVVVVNKIKGSNNVLFFIF